MRAKTKTLILSVILLGTSHAHADNERPINAPISTDQNPPSRVVSHIDYLGNRFFTLTEKPVYPESILRGETADMQSRDVTANEKPDAGMHWVTSDHHPALELRLSDQSAIRFHPSRHGGGVTAAWGF
jgi:hypothetical protein